MPEHALRRGRHRAVGSGPRPGATTTVAAVATIGAALSAPLAAQAAPAPAVPAQPAATQPASTQPASAQPASVQPASVQPASVQPAPAEESPAARAAHAEPLVPGTPCSISARACVDLESQRAWLIEDGQVVRGPMRVTTGAKGQETPVGHSLRVYRHDIDHTSEESRLPDGRPAPMPYSVFFADGGVAFHGGSLQRASAGCVHLKDSDAKAVYEFLQNGDKVQVVNGSQERAARAALTN